MLSNTRGSLFLFLYTEDGLCVMYSFCMFSEFKLSLGAELDANSNLSSEMNDTVSKCYLCMFGIFVRDHAQALKEHFATATGITHKSLL